MWELQGSGGLGAKSLKSAVLFTLISKAEVLPTKWPVCFQGGSFGEYCFFLQENQKCLIYPLGKLDFVIAAPF